MKEQITEEIFKAIKAMVDRHNEIIANDYCEIMYECLEKGLSFREADDIAYEATRKTRDYFMSLPQRKIYESKACARYRHTII